MMLSGANVLVLDEPTNHLDLESITALNNGLIRYPETVLFTSHDHQFIQTIADRVMDIADGKITDYKGTYDEFLETFDEDKLKNTDIKNPVRHYKPRGIFCFIHSFSSRNISDSSGL